MKKLTLRELLEKVYQKLEMSEVYFGHGTTNAWDEAIWLISSVIDPTHEKDLTGKELLSDLQLLEIEKLVEKRIQEKKPLAYLIQRAYFAGFPFYVDERVLIPRSPISELIQKQFSPWIQLKKVHRILDLCTGSGCIAIACAKVFPEATVIGSDISKEALEVAEINVNQHHLEKRIQLIHSDLFDQLPSKKFDLIVSNPPYISEKEMLEIPSEYQHEPSIALKAGSKGLDLVEVIIQDSLKYLNKDGVLVVEVGDRHLVEKRFPDLPFVWLDFEEGEGDVLLIKN